MPSGLIYVCECVCIKARNWNNEHSSIISENIHSVVLRRITSSAPPAPLYTSKLSPPKANVCFSEEAPRPPVRMSHDPESSLVVDGNPACEWVSDQVLSLSNESYICFTAPGRTAAPQAVCHRGLFYVHGVRSDPF